jgi:hypothetical protein
MQRDLFPSAAGLPTPEQRMQARDAIADNTVGTFLLYTLFAVLPGGVCALSIVFGAVYGETAYRFVVSWLFYWVLLMLTTDPFVTRYRRQLLDIIQHWQKLWPCTQTMLYVAFGHGFWYHVLLWTVAYVFVLFEEALRVFWHMNAAANVTTFIFVVMITVFLVLWLGRIVDSHGLLIAARQTIAPGAVPPPTEPAIDVELGGGVRVRLPEPTATSPDVRLDGDAHLDLVDHLQRNRVQMTVDHNTLIIEPQDRFECYRVALWVSLVVLGAVSLALVLRDSFGFFPLSTLMEYGVVAVLVLAVLLVSMYGSRFADPTYLQLLLLLSTTVPVLYGNWMLVAYAANATNGEWPALLIFLHLVFSLLYMTMQQMLVDRLAAPSTYARLLMLPQLLGYLDEYVVFGFTPFGFTYILILVLTAIHNILWSTGLYSDVWRSIRDGFTGALPNDVPEDPIVTNFRDLLAMRHSMLVFAQDTVSDVISLATISWLVFVLWMFDIPIVDVLPSFSVQPLALRLCVLLLVRVLAWVCGQLVFRRKIRAMSPELLRSRPTTANLPSTGAGMSVSPPNGAGTPTLAQQLDLYVKSLKLSVFQSARVRACLEDDIPELLAVIDRPHNSQSTETLAEVLFLQIAERQWLLHPAILRKYGLYWHACIYFLLFVVLQSANTSLPLRYAWFRTFQPH